MVEKLAPKFLVLLIAVSLAAAGAGCARKVEEPEKEITEEMVEENAAAEEEMLEGEVVEEEVPPPVKVPDFATICLGGGRVVLSQIEAKVIILNFWLAVGSPQSEDQVVELIKLYNTYRDRGVEIIGISLDQGRNAEVRTFIQDNQIRYPVCVDEGYKIFERYQPGQFPATIIVGEDLILIKQFAGFVSFAELEAELTALLGE